MASILTCVATSAAWCFCTASASLLSSCCGNDKASTIPPSVNSGRKRSVLLLFTSIGLSLIFQWGLSRLIIDRVPSQIVLHDDWLEDCRARLQQQQEQQPNNNNDKMDASLQQQQQDNTFLYSCVGNQANYRVGMATLVFFLLAGLAALCKPTANREAWPAKYTLYLFLVVATMFLPSTFPLLRDDIFLHIARAGSALFIVLEQLVIVDIAHQWNESWVEKSNQAESNQPGTGQAWLYAILLSCVIFFLATLGLLIYTIIEFSGCPLNNTVIAITVLFIILVLAAQLSGEEGSLLSSAIVSAWAMYLGFAAVSKNPNPHCNPHVGESSILAILLGMGITIISLVWAGWSYTAHSMLSSHNNNDDDNAIPSARNDTALPEQTVVGGIVTGGTSTTTPEATYGAMAEEDGQKRGTTNTTTDETPSSSSHVMTWRLNLALALIACWSSMILTHWGEIIQPKDENDSGVSVNNPNVGKISLWMIVASQWLVLCLYLWTLIAPRLFPDRDFS